MQVINDINEFEYDKKSAVTVGTFDGIHLGHREIIAVSYTHLDVYKRQERYRKLCLGRSFFP